MNTGILYDPERPQLRQEVNLQQFDSSHESQKYLLSTDDGTSLLISQDLYHMLGLMNGDRDIETIINECAKQYNINCNKDDIQHVVDTFLIPRNLLFGLKQDTAIGKKPRASHIRFQKSLLSQHLTARIGRFFSILFGPTALVLVSFFIILCHGFFYAANSTAFGRMDTQVAWAFLLLWVSTMFHEIGHASASVFFRTPPGEIGLGIYMFFPVFYTDVSRAWQLNRYQRAVVDVAGIYFQLLFSSVVVILDLIHPNGIYKVTVIAISTSCLATINPFFKFDGYWLLSDLTGIPNLRQKSIELLTSNIGFRRNINLNFKRKQLVILVAYTLVCNVFFIYFILNLVALIPPTFSKVPHHIELLFFYVKIHSFSEAVTAFSSLLFALLLLFFLIYVGLRLFRFARKRLKTIRRTSASG